MTLEYRTCPLCHDGELAYYNGRPVVDNVGLLHAQEQMVLRIEQVARETGLTPVQLVGRGQRRPVMVARRRLVDLLLHDGLSEAMIARGLGRTPSAVRNMIEPRVQGQVRTRLEVR